MYNNNLAFDIEAGKRMFYVEVMGYIYCDDHHGWCIVTGRYSHSSSGVHRRVAVRPVGVLTHWDRDKMTAIFQTAFSNTLSWMKM